MEIIGQNYANFGKYLRCSIFDYLIVSLILTSALYHYSKVLSFDQKGHVNNTSTMQFFTEISRNTQSKSNTLPFTKCLGFPK